MMTVKTCLRTASAAILLSFFLIAPLEAQQGATSKAVEAARATVDPERLQAARDLLVANQLDKQLVDVVPAALRSASQMMMPIFGPLFPNAEAREEFKDVFETIIAEIEKQFVARQAELIELTAVTYARILDVKDMKEMAEFGRSPIGQKFASATPEFISEIMPKMMQIMMGQAIVTDDDIAPEKLAAAEALFKASKLDELFDTMISSQMSAEAGQGGDPQAAEAAEKMMEKMSANMKKRRDEIYKVVAAAYAKRFTVDEINEVTAFYTSDSGRRIASAMPQLLVEQQKVTQGFMAEMMSELDEKVREALKNRGIKL